MRIIAGTARGKKLECSTGKDIRPTTDRAREALFSMLFSRLGPFQGFRVLDLFAGTGALGLEAVSRGAREALFVEQAKTSLAVLRSNINHCGFAANCRVISQDAERALQGDLSGPFDLIFMDPPYGQGLIRPCLEQIADSELLAPDGILCAEADPSEEVPTEVGDLIRVADRKYARSRIYLFEREVRSE